MHNTDQDRTDQLATQVRRLRWMNYGMAAVIAAGVISACETQNQSVLWARQIGIVNEMGQKVVTLGTNTSGGGAIVLWSSSGTPVMELNMDGSGSGALSTFGSAGQRLVLIGSDQTGGGAIATFGSDGARQLEIGADTSGSCSIAVFDSTGTLGASAHGDGRMLVFDQYSDLLVSVGRDPISGAGMVAVYDQVGSAIVELASDRDGNGSVVTRTQDGETAGKFP